jgi:hypothetical protein
MRYLITSAFGALIALRAVAQSTPPQQYPSLNSYMMTAVSEIALARSAAPANVADNASVKVLSDRGYRIAVEGTNGFVCIVMRGWTAPTFSPPPFLSFVYDASIRAPICFDPVAAKTVLPYYELRSQLGMKGKSPDDIAIEVAAAYARGDLPERGRVSFGYMWSASQHLGTGIGHWHPHLMIFAPYYNNTMIGGNPFGASLPQVTDDADTPFAVVVVPVDDRLAVAVRP